MLGTIGLIAFIVLFVLILAILIYREVPKKSKRVFLVGYESMSLYPVEGQRLLTGELSTACCTIYGTHSGKLRQGDTLEIIQLAYGDRVIVASTGHVYTKEENGPMVQTSFAHKTFVWMNPDTGGWMVMAARKWRPLSFVTKNHMATLSTIQHSTIVDRRKPFNELLAG